MDRPKTWIWEAWIVALGLVVVGLLSSGCGVGRAQVATQTALVAVAEGLDVADRAVVAVGQSRVDDAVLVVRSRCAAGCSDPVQELRDELAPWYQAVGGLEAARATLEALQAAAEIWYVSDALPDSWPALCEAVEDEVRAVLALLEIAGVDVQEAVGPDDAATLSRLVGLVGPICRIAGGR
jgi:hypothetical protein